MKGKILYSIISVILLLSFVDNKIKAQTSDNRQPDLKDFKVSIVNSDYSMAYSVLIILTNKKLEIKYRGGLVGDKDSLLFSKDMLASDTLRQISEISLTKLKTFYANACISDGSQIVVRLAKYRQNKSIQLSNYYQEDIGKIIYLINSLVPTKYKVWYNKEKLLADYKKCR
jgi:hypothetical protein